MPANCDIARTVTTIDKKSDDLFYWYGGWQLFPILFFGILVMNCTMD